MVSSPLICVHTLNRLEPANLDISYLQSMGKRTFSSPKDVSTLSLTRIFPRGINTRAHTPLRRLSLQGENQTTLTQKISSVKILGAVVIFCLMEGMFVCEK